MSIWCSMMTGPMMTVQKGQLIPSKFPHIPNHHKPPIAVSSSYSLNFAEQENRTSLFSKVLLWAKLKPGCSFILFFWFMNRLISTSQQIKSVVRWFFPILQFNCGRDVSSQYFISTNARLSSFLAAVSFFWKEQRQQEVTNFAFDKRHFSQLTCNSTTAKANLVSCSFAGWSAALMNREILKKEK